jgi:hypothetical protein
MLTAIFHFKRNPQLPGTRKMLSDNKVQIGVNTLTTASTCQKLFPSSKNHEHQSKVSFYST